MNEKVGQRSKLKSEIRVVSKRAGQNILKDVTFSREATHSTAQRSATQRTAMAVSVKLEAGCQKGERGGEGDSHTCGIGQPKE